MPEVAAATGGHKPYGISKGHGWFTAAEITECCKNKHAMNTFSSVWWVLAVTEITISLLFFYHLCSRGISRLQGSTVGNDVTMSRNLSKVLLR